MLNVHGLVIIATELQAESKYQYTSLLKFEVASETISGDTMRHSIVVSVPNNKAESFKQDIQVGKICEIVYATWEEFTSLKTQDTNKKYSRVEIRVKSEHFRILQPCVYYADIPNITAMEKPNE
jgi:hypothetical protein